MDFVVLFFRKRLQVSKKNYNFAALSLNAFHNTLDTALAEVVRVALHS